MSTTRQDDNMSRTRNTRIEQNIPFPLKSYSAWSHVSSNMGLVMKSRKVPKEERAVEDVVSFAAVIRVITQRTSKTRTSLRAVVRMVPLTQLWLVIMFLSCWDYIKFCVAHFSDFTPHVYVTFLNMTSKKEKLQSVNNIKKFFVDSEFHDRGNKINQSRIPT